MLVINPGSGPVAGSSRSAAIAAIEAFVKDLELPEVQVGDPPDAADSGGRFGFTLSLGERKVEVDMPGLPIERVRYMGEAGQNIWNFPRLYVDGSSWVWVYALNSARSGLTGEDEED